MITRITKSEEVPVVNSWSIRKYLDLMIEQSFTGDEKPFVHVPKEFVENVQQDRIQQMQDELVSKRDCLQIQLNRLTEKVILAEDNKLDELDADGLIKTNSEGVSSEPIVNTHNETSRGWRDYWNSIKSSSDRFEEAINNTSDQRSELKKLEFVRNALIKIPMLKHIGWMRRKFAKISKQLVDVQTDILTEVLLQESCLDDNTLRDVDDIHNSCRAEDIFNITRELDKSILKTF